MQNAPAKSWSARGASHQPAFMSSLSCVYFEGVLEGLNEEKVGRQQEEELL